MTGRSRWLLLLAVLGAWLGLVRYLPSLAFLSIAVFVWIFVEWARFAIRTRVELASIQVQRELNGRAKENDIVWAGRRLEVVLKLQSRFKMRPGLQIRDVVSEHFALLVPTSHRESALQENRRSSIGRIWNRFTNATTDLQRPPQEFVIEHTCSSEEHSYSLRPRAAGKVNLPGVRLTMQDRYGFFRQHRFVACAQTVCILPDYHQSGERQSTIKRFNSLPRHGIHRLQRAGLGSELLELREYVPGDPPKSIAWKVSARRDALMTRQYESEVPVRVNFLIEGALSTRMGGYGMRLLDQFNFVAASVAKASLSIGDPVSATLVDEQRTVRLRPFSGDRGFLQFLQTLAEFSDAPPPPSLWLTPQMVNYALQILNESQPELLARSYQALPFSLFPGQRRKFRLAGILGQLFDLSAQEQYECYYDEVVLSKYVVRLIHESGRPWMSPFVVQPPGTNQPPQNFELISKVMSQAVLRAKDNEVYVIMSDLLTCAPYMDQLQKVIKLAIARHHRVALVCPSIRC